MRHALLHHPVVWEVRAYFLVSAPHTGLSNLFACDAGTTGSAPAHTPRNRKKKKKAGDPLPRPRCARPTVRRNNPPPPVQRRGHCRHWARPRRRRGRGIDPRPRGVRACGGVARRGGMRGARPARPARGLPKVAPSPCGAANPAGHHAPPPRCAAAAPPAVRPHPRPRPRGTIVVAACHPPSTPPRAPRPAAVIAAAVPPTAPSRAPTPPRPLYFGC